MLKVTTESGAVYDIDLDNRLVRRHGEDYEGSRANGKWREFARVHVALGAPLIIIWPQETERLADTPEGASVPMTKSTRVVEVMESRVLDG